jgi:hypothetical protein
MKVARSYIVEVITDGKKIKMRTTWFKSAEQLVKEWLEKEDTIEVNIRISNDNIGFSELVSHTQTDIDLYAKPG